MIWLIYYCCCCGGVFRVCNCVGLGVVCVIVRKLLMGVVGLVMFFLNSLLVFSLYVWLSFGRVVVVVRLVVILMVELSVLEIIIGMVICVVILSSVEILFSGVIFSIVILVV